MSEMVIRRLPRICGRFTESSSGMVVGPLSGLAWVFHPRHGWVEVDQASEDEEVMTITMSDLAYAPDVNVVPPTYARAATKHLGLEGALKNTRPSRYIVVRSVIQPMSTNRKIEVWGRANDDIGIQELLQARGDDDSPTAVLDTETGQLVRFGVEGEPLL